MHSLTLRKHFAQKVSGCGTVKWFMTWLGPTRGFTSLLLPTIAKATCLCRLFGYFISRDRPRHLKLGIEKKWKLHSNRSTALLCSPKLSLESQNLHGLCKNILEYPLNITMEISIIVYSIPPHFSWCKN